MEAAEGEGGAVRFRGAPSVDVVRVPFSALRLCMGVRALEVSWGGGDGGFGGDDGGGGGGGGAFSGPYIIFGCDSSFAVCYFDVGVSAQGA